MILELHSHWSILTLPFVALLACFVILGSAVFAFPGSPTWLIEAIGVFCGLPLIWLGVRQLQRQTTSLIVTDQRVALRTGVVVKKGWDVRLERINDVSYDQSLWGRIFRVGDIALDTGGGEVGDKSMQRVPHPDGLKVLIFERQSARIDYLRSNVEGIITGPNQAVRSNYGTPGSAPTGLDTAGTHTAGTHTTGTHTAGTHRIGSGTTGFDMAHADPASAITNSPIVISGSGLSVAEQIEKLDEMRNRGVITDREFELEKKRLFGI